MPIYHVNLSFAELPDAELDAFTENVIAKLTSNGTFSAPPVTAAGLQTLLDEFVEALANAADGGKADTIIKNQARATLVGALRQDALYVQAHGNNDPATLLGSGYLLSSLNRTPAPLATPVVESITNGASTTLVLRVKTVRNAKSYEVQRSADGGLTWVYATSSAKARQIIVPGLTPGTTYQIRLRAIGGATGSSDWSAPVSAMST